MLRIHKRFGGKGEAELSERKGDGWSVLAKQEEAEEQLLQELGAQPAGGRAGSQPERWGALQWLFVPQELRELPDPGHDAASRIGLDRAGITPALETVWKLATAKYDESFTATGQRAKASEASKLRAELETLEKQRETLDGQVKKLEGYSREYSEMQDRIPTAQKDLDEARDLRREAEQSAVDLSAAEGQLQALKAELANCEQRRKTAAEVLRERTMREEAVKLADKALADAKGELESARVKQGVLKEQFEQSKAHATSEGDKVARLRRELSDAQHLIRVRDQRGKIAESEALLQTVLDFDRQLLEATKAYPGDPPDGKTMRAAGLIGDRDVMSTRPGQAPVVRGLALPTRFYPTPNV